jgi:hypothetical protein
LSLVQSSCSTCWGALSLQKLLHLLRCFVLGSRQLVILDNGCNNLSLLLWMLVLEQLNCVILLVLVLPFADAYWYINYKFISILLIESKFLWWLLYSCHSFPFLHLPFYCYNSLLP